MKDRNLHVLLIPSWYPSYPGDVSGCFFRDQALALLSGGCKVGVLYPQIRPLRQWKKIFTGPFGISRELDREICTHRMHGTSWVSILPKLKIGHWLKSASKLFDDYIELNGLPDIIHAHSLFNGGIAASKIKELYALPYVITEHSSIYHRRLVDRTQYKFAHNAVKSADALLAVSKPFADLLESFFASINRKWHVVPNVLPAEFEEKVLNTPPPASVFKFVNISLLTHKKGIEDLLSAFARAFRGDSSTNLLLGGDGELKTDLKRRVLKLGIENQVKFLGMLSRAQVVETLSACHAYVLASHYETFGVSLIEALSLGKPVVATRCGGPEDIVRKEDGLLVEVKDIDGLAVAMKKVKDNYERYDTAQIRESCIARYGSKRIVEELCIVYGEVLSSTKGKRQ